MASDAIDGDLDLAEISAIRAARAFSDPVIVHEPTKGFALDSDHDVMQMVPIARLEQSMDAPLDERIEFATWPEVLAYCATAAMDQRFSNRSFAKAYRFTFRRYLEKWSSLPLHKQPEPLRTEPDMTDQEYKDLGTLRFAIRRDQDKHFVENRYDELDVEGVPKNFWLTHRQRRDEPDRPDEYSSSALSNIVDGYVDADSPDDQ